LKQRKTIIVTGNMGYIGPIVVRELIRTIPGVYIIGLDTGYFAHCLTGARWIPERMVHEQHFCDIRDVSDSLLERADVIIHLAAISNDPMGRAFEAPTFEINATASGELARRSKVAGVKTFVFASSCSIYGSAGDDARTEDAPLNPLTAYARSKVFMEQALHALVDGGFTATCLRFATACGWSPRTRLDLVLNDFVAAAVVNRRIEVLSDGSPWRPLVHIEDMARALVWATGREAERSEKFLAVNVGSDQWNYQIRDLASAVADLVPGTEVSVNDSAAPDKRSYRVNFGLLAQIAPAGLISWNLEDAVRDLFVNLKALGFEDRNFRDSRMIRLSELRNLQEQCALDAQLRWTSQQSSAAAARTVNG
jgi:nucleoside-diphosphate-sugar epimerase